MRATREPTPTVIAEREWSKRRRARNRAANLCVNENRAGTHGAATHGCRCECCHLVHSGKEA